MQSIIFYYKKIINYIKYLFFSGDTRANQNPQLTVLQIILLREHNRIANYLAGLNSHWSDETIFQETRRILTAIHQNIVYYEWLPIFLGSNIPIFLRAVLKYFYILIYENKFLANCKLHLFQNVNPIWKYQI